MTNGIFNLYIINTLKSDIYEQKCCKSRNALFGHKRHQWKLWLPSYFLYLSSFITFYFFIFFFFFTTVNNKITRYVAYTHFMIFWLSFMWMIKSSMKVNSVSRFSAGRIPAETVRTSCYKIIYMHVWELLLYLKYGKRSKSFWLNANRWNHRCVVQTGCSSAR
jgi:hypothetical protein